MISHEDVMKLSELLDIWMKWDGKTPTANISIRESVLTGHPQDVEFVFDLLNRVRNEIQHLELTSEILKRKLLEIDNLIKDMNHEI